jgi:methylglutaconyl-CoA hydratase
MALVEVVTRGPVCTITLADEARRNVLSATLMDELVAAIDQAEGDSEVRVVVVTNRGRVFCAGADLSAQREGGPVQGTASLGELLGRIRRSPKPFVGRVNGHCVAGGVGLAAVMDVSIAVRDATFGFTEVRVGVAPAIISVVCLPKMRPGDARAAFLRGNRFDAVQAAATGLINAAVDPAALDDEVDQVLEDILAGEPHALAVAKQLTVVVPTLEESEAFAWATGVSAGLFTSEAAREGMAAFLEKRPANWVRHVGDDATSPG